MSAAERVRDVRRKIEQLTNDSCQTLTFRGKPLKDEQTLQDYNIPEHAVLQQLHVMDEAADTGAAEFEKEHFRVGFGDVQQSLPM